MAPTRILIVEDESIVAQDIRRSLEHLGYEVCGTVASGEEALTQAQAHKPDLVLMDVVLAGEMDGIETADSIRKRFDIPVVYLTAHTDDDTLARATVTGPLGYIVKPFSDKDLKSVVEMAVYKAQLDARRKKAEDTLRESEERLRLLVEGADDIIVLNDPDGRYLYYNGPSRYGIRASDLLGKTPYDYFDAKDAAPIVQQVQEVATSGQAKSFENRVTWQGETFWFLDQRSPVRDSAGRIKAVASICRNITNRRRAEDALRQANLELAISNRIANAFLTVPNEDIYNEVLQIVLDAVKSEFGFFGYIDAEGSLVCPSLTEEIWERCQMPDKRIVFPRDTWKGLWGRALLEKKTLCSNEPLHPPDGHIPIDRALAVPLLHKDEVIGLIAVGNKAADYDDMDRHLLELAAAHIAPILHARLESEVQYRARVQAEEALRGLQMQIRAGKRFAGIVGNDPKMRELFDTIQEVARVGAPVLIQGDSGTGKELVATAIHNEGPRADKSFIPVNCGALPETLLESELFGHVRGAFSGAIRDKKGRFELADGGTIFLDEVGELSLPIQVKLLRVLQEGTFERVGGEDTFKVNVRIISATNKDLAKEVAAGRFREDLYYRLCVIPIAVPALRERRGDIPLLAAHILQQQLEVQGGRDLLISNEALELLMAYDWPGNVRELQNAIHFALVKCKGDTLEPSHFPPTLSVGERRLAAAAPKKSRKRSPDRRTVLRMIEETGGNRKEAARRLGVSRATLYRILGPGAAQNGE